ncbi:hypothetical protein ERO13_A09G073000v2 [Gossypium hirsutum]|uniref:B3 domain-containing transcription factor LEC2 isoform X2 n=1 Tax=Gossypium hirsutum TaxID=3635 RepID=A0A1U8HZH0_GOSHI|nr:B3 domain-containing transcription factor LEC2-like isoform X2 [Gossypium hirsutum]KAG4182869.1 hypothetical protein ERO13_A09G073000v2 [Gossypium hirsutum]
MHGVLCRISPRLGPHLNQRWRQHYLKHTHWSDGYPETTFLRPLVSQPTTPLAISRYFTLVVSLLSFYLQFHGLFLSPQPIPLHHLTRFSCFFHTWTHPNGSILHPHDLIEPHFVLTQNRKEEHTESSALSSTFFSDRNQPCNPLDSSSSHCTFVLMENSYIPFFSTTATSSTTPITTTTTTHSPSNMDWSQNSDFSMFEPMNSQFQHPSQLLSPNQSLQFPYNHSIEQAPVYPFFTGQKGFEFGVCKEQERRTNDPYRTRLARINRKLARQRSLQRNANSGASTQVDARRLINSGADTDTNKNKDTKKDLYRFCTPDNKRLRVLLKKELKNSDVGSLGRIVLPKRDAEVNLPPLSDKEGIQVMIKDVYSNHMWTLKYKFWSNNKSRMYVLENTGDFVKQNGLGTGDSLTLYEDESKNLYFSITKVATVAVESSSNIQYYHNVNNNGEEGNDNSNNMYLPFTSQSKDDEAASLELFMEQQEPNDFIMTLPMDSTYGSHTMFPEETRHLPNNVDQMPSLSRSVDDISINFDDCYGGLDMLPEANQYNFSF